MLEQLSITNFKCFSSKTTFTLKPLNVFSGLNGRGKSTVFQSLLLLAQSLIKRGDIEHLYLNGDYVNLDLFDDIINSKSKDKIVQYEIVSNNSGLKKLDLAYKEYSDRVGIISGLEIDGKDYFQARATIGVDSDTKEKEKLQHFLYGYPKETVNSLFRNVYYISADRLGPTRDERKADEYTNNPLGILGEHRLNTLSANELLLADVSKWLSYIMDGATLRIEGKSKQDSVLQLLLSNGSQSDYKVKAINCGYGYSYVLSIIIIALMAQPGSTVFVENPEAHLHPRAQSRLTKLLCLLANKDVQVFIETHSEHVINRARLSILDKEIGLTHEDVSIYFFGENFDITRLELDEDAQFLNESCLKGFVDQQELDTAEILKLGLFK